MRLPRFKGVDRQHARLACLLGAIVLLVQASQTALAAEALQLEVFINGVSTDKIGSFVITDGEKIGAERSELGELGLTIGDAQSTPDSLIVLDGISGLKYRYDERNQSLYLTVADGLRKTITYDASPHETTTAESGYGGVLNYNLFATANANAGSWSLGTGAASATLDARAFSPFGVLSQSAIVRLPSSNGVDVLRLDSAFTHSDPGTMTTYTAGDMVSRGFAWTRPIRMGGLQVRRNFGLRPDIITEPLPAVNGSAAVPSTVDVFVNNLKTFSRSIDAGPYQITDIPVTTGNGEARVVLHDAAGHTVETTVPYYVSPSLLRPGLSDFSLEAGLPRLAYATPSDQYAASKPAISASLRRGVTTG